MHLDLSGEPPFDLTSLLSSIYFILGCRRKSHCIRDRNTEDNLTVVSADMEDTMRLD